MKKYTKSQHKFIEFIINCLYDSNILFLYIDLKKVMKCLILTVAQAPVLWQATTQASGAPGGCGLIAGTAT